MCTLKELRKKNGLTLLDVSWKLGYKYPSSYRKIESGEQQLKSDQIILLAEIFSVPKEKILRSFIQNE